MRKLRLPFLLLIIVAVAVGIAWGLKIKRAADKRKAPEADARVVKVLALKNALPMKIVKAFEAEANIKVELTEENNPDLLLARLEGPATFDVVTLLSSQTAQAVSTFKIQPLKQAEIAGFDSVSADFVDLPGTLHQPSVVPLYWGLTGFVTKSEEPEKSWSSVLSGKAPEKIELKPSLLDLAYLAQATGPDKESDSAFHDRAKKLRRSSHAADTFFVTASEASTSENNEVVELHHGESAFPPYAAEGWTFKLADEGSMLWILTLALGAKVENESGAEKLIEYLLKPKVAEELSLETHQASCNRAVENSKRLNEILKPSHLRTVPLARIKVPDETLIARAVLLKDLAVAETHE
jgi:spermidine/putrescine transport system substrate-binding protein